MELENKEFIKAMHRLEQIINLESDMLKANEKLREFTDKHFCLLSNLSNNNEMQFNNFIPKMFCDLLDAIDNGQLILKKDAKI